MFAYCNNNPVCAADPSGNIVGGICGGCQPDMYDGGGYTYYPVPPDDINDNEHPNREYICFMFGVNEIEQIPGYKEGCMFFAENTYSVSLGVISVVYGKTIVMDQDKYCEYTFCGLAPGISFHHYPGDATISEGIVYGVNNPSDYSGFFFGGTANMVATGEGGAVALNGVTARILGLVGYGVPSFGCSGMLYFTGATKWTYGKAPIVQSSNQYKGFWGRNASPAI